MKTTLNKQLVSYIETEILPLYASFDKAHHRDHAEYVIRESLSLAKHYDVNADMVYAIAACHDLGLKEDRANHHLVSGKIVRSDMKLHDFFTDKEIETMAQAVEDHRASCQHEPRSIYGMIVAEADRCIDGRTIVLRTIQYGLSHYPEFAKEEHYKRFKAHMKEKYAEGGYLKIWLPESSNKAKLTDFQQLLKDEAATRSLFEELWTQCQSINN